MAKANKHVRKRANRQQQKKHSLSFGFSGQAALRQTGKWPLLECLISSQWREPGMLIQLCVARRSAKGEVAAGVFLVDLGCLGVKNAYASTFATEGSYRRELLAQLKATQTLITCDLNLAAKVVDEGVKYAQSLGFRPNKDIKQALMVMGAAYPEECAVDIPLGKDGKPFFINGPFDDVDRIQRILDKNVGPGNYDFLLQIGGPMDDDMEFDPDHTVDFEEDEDDV